MERVIAGLEYQVEQGNNMEVWDKPSASKSYSSTYLLFFQKTKT